MCGFVVDVHCPVCGASFDDIVRSGRAGCAECYHTFSEPVKAGDRAHPRGSSASREGAGGQTCRSRVKAASWL